MSIFKKYDEPQYQVYLNNSTYINTLIKPGVGHLKYEWVGVLLGTGFMFGFGNSGSVGRFKLQAGASGQNTSFYIYNANVSGSAITSQYVQTYNRYLKIEMDSDSPELKINNKIVRTGTTTNIPSSVYYYCYINGAHSDTTPGSGKQICKSFKIWENNILTFNLEIHEDGQCYNSVNGDYLGTFPVISTKTGMITNIENTNKKISFYTFDPYCLTFDNSDRLNDIVINYQGHANTRFEFLLIDKSNTSRKANFGTSRPTGARIFTMSVGYGNWWTFNNTGIEVPNTDFLTKLYGPIAYFTIQLNSGVTMTVPNFLDEENNKTIYSWDSGTYSYSEAQANTLTEWWIGTYPSTSLGHFVGVIYDFRIYEDDELVCRLKNENGVIIDEINNTPITTHGDWSVEKQLFEIGV